MGCLIRGDIGEGSRYFGGWETSILYILTLLQLFYLDYIFLSIKS